jgi:2',3'-cyclic-nucleotide 2'-phosphodiesterase (5'-nucleotidase family)/endonuclease YncB( thermonuclease family)
MDVQTDVASVSSYKDDTSAHWGARYIAGVTQAGLMQGDGNGDFRPDDLITREELAVVLTRAAKANVQGKGAQLSVADQHQVSDWAKDYVQAAIELGLMKGDGTNFNPAQHAQRQEVAVVAVNFVNTVQKTPVLTAVTDSSVTINGAQYAIAANLQGLLNAKNAEVLQGANLRFEAANGTIQAVNYLELNRAGSAAGAGEVEFSRNLVLDAQNAVIQGNVKVAADYISLQNLQVAGDLEIGSALQNDFYAKNLQVSGNTIVNGGDNNTVVFADSKLQTVEINKQDVRVEPKGQTQLQQMNVNSNASIVADGTVTIPKLTLQGGAEQVALNVNIGTVEVKGAQNTVLTGDANIANLKADGSGVLTLSTKGKIDKVEVTNGNGALALGDDVKVDALSLPEGKSAKDVVRDYDNHNGQVGSVNGQEQPKNQNSNQGHGTNNTQRVAEDKAALTAAVLLGQNVALTSVTTNLTLPTKGENNSSITWTSSDEAVVSTSGVVTRPAYLAGDATVTLTATLRKGNAVDTKTFTVTVQKLAATDADAVTISKNALTDASLLGANSSLTSVTSNLTLPTAGAENTAIAWTSDHPELIDADGTVNRLLNEDATVTLTATITKGNATDTKTFTVTVLKDADTQQALESAQQALQLQFATGDTANSVTQNLVLPAAGANDTTITWATSNANLVSESGVVTRPQYGAAAHNVTLTATISKNGFSVTKMFALDIKFLNVKVQLLSINDLHGKIDQTYQESVTTATGPKVDLGRMDYLATHLYDHKAQNPNNTFIVHVGDATGGSSPVSALFLDEPTVETLQAIGFGGGTVGNHEFDRGTQELLRLKNGGASANNPNYAGMGFPLAVANVKYKANGEHVLPPYFVQEIGGVKVGFIGVVTKSAAGMVMPSGIQDIEFTDETQAVNEAAAELKSKGIHAMVVLAHMDLTQDSPTTVSGPAADLAKNIDSDVDVILAAHNHKIAKGTVNDKLLVQAYEYGKAFADVDLEIDPVTQDIVSKQAEVVYNTHDVAPNAQVKSVIDKYLEKAGPTLHSVVGTSAVEMLGGYTATGDNALGNLIADSMRVSMNSDFAMMNGGGIRTNLKQGEIKWEDLFNILPFNNILTKVSVKGSALTDIINAQLSVRYGADYSVAGLKYTYDYTTAKVTNVTKADGSPIDPNATYTLTVNNFMATATSAKYAIIGKSALSTETGPEDLPALIDYVKSFNGAIPAPELGRIKISNTMTATNVLGAGDSVKVENLKAGQVVSVYNIADAASTESRLLGKATVATGENSATISGLNLNQAGGTVYVTITVGTQEGVRFPVTYTAEPNNGGPTPTLTVGTTTFNESDANDGTVTGTEVLTLANGTLAADITKADVTVNNLPAGLTYEVTRDSDTQLTVTFSGKATAHTAANSVANAFITIAQAKVTGATYNVSSNNFAINFKDPAQPTYTDIATARGLAANTVTTIHGIITADNSAVGGGKLSTYVQDATGGVNVFMNSIPAGIDLKEGDEVVITGKMTAYQKLTEIAPTSGTDIKVLSKNNPLPAVKPTTIAALANATTAEPLEGQLVNVHGYLLSKPDTSTGSAWNLTLVDADFNTVTLRVIGATNTISSLETGTWYDITGIVGQYADTYQVMPRKAADITASATQDPAPSTAGVVKQSTVLRGVDGDTIKLATPIYGADNVRFLSIDTPETVYNNMSQGPHGDAAHHSLDQLLPPNTPVELHFGAEPTDKYGRLLAHVFKDGKDMNLEQVRLGFATTYQIYPNLEGFETYADALKEAKLAKRGIWNPADPLLEMPFVFRARLDGNAPLSKPVGDFYTKQYVDPALWYTIPAENRVFFWNETDVKAAGFTKKTYLQSNTSLFSDVYQVDEQNGTVSGFPYGVSLDTVKATVKAVVGATVKFTLADGTTEISTNTLAQGNKIVVTAADGTQQAYTVNTDPIPLPQPVSNVTGTSADRDVTAKGGVANTIRWNDGQYGMSYEVFRGTTDNLEEAVSLGNVPAGRQIFTDETAQAEMTYSYFVVAKNTSGSASAVRVAVTSAVDLDQAPVYTAPSNLASSSSDIRPALVGGLKTVLTWTDSTAPNATYNILRGTVNDPALAEKVGTADAGVQRFEDTTALAGTQYYYFVSTTVNGSTLVSDASTVVTAKDTHLLISQVYGGGGAGSTTAASYKYDFVELFNPSAEDISLNDYSLQYGSTSSTTAFSMIKLTGTIPAGGYFLIKLSGSATAGGAELTDADLDTTPGNVTPAPTTLTLAASNGKIALVADQTAVSNHLAASVIDFVGYGTANDAEGGTAVSALSNITAAVRKFVNGMFQDTDNNKNDFQVLTPTPHNSKSAKP